MLKFLTLSSAAVLTALLSGCVVAPAPYGPYGYGYGYEAPAGVAYVAPTYVAPGPGWVWMYNARFGWGYHHPNYGWHRGWR